MERKAMKLKKNKIKKKLLPYLLTTLAIPANLAQDQS